MAYHVSAYRLKPLSFMNGEDSDALSARIPDRVSQLTHKMQIDEAVKNARADQDFVSRVYIREIAHIVTQIEALFLQAQQSFPQKPYSIQPESVILSDRFRVQMELNERHFPGISRCFICQDEGYSEYKITIENQNTKCKVAILGSTLHYLLNHCYCGYPETIERVDPALLCELFEIPKSKAYVRLEKQKWLIENNTNDEILMARRYEKSIGELAARVQILFNQAKESRTASCYGPSRCSVDVIVEDSFHIKMASVQQYREPPECCLCSNTEYFDVQIMIRNLNNQHLVIISGSALHYLLGHQSCGIPETCENVKPENLCKALGFPEIKIPSELFCR